jgi:hypothetical protein
MTNLNTKLTKETQSRIKRLFGVTNIYENNGQLVIESRDAINLDWAKYIAKELKSNCKKVIFKSNA